MCPKVIGKKIDDVRARDISNYLRLLTTRCFL